MDGPSGGRGRGIVISSAHQVGRIMMRGILVCSLLLIVITLMACSEGVRPAKTIYADGTRGCKQRPQPVILWDRAGAGAAHGKPVAEISHGTKLEVVQTEEYFGVNYYQVVYEGQRGWVPENFVSKIPPSCP